MTRAKDISKILTDADLSGTLDVTGDLTVDTNTLYVDSANNRVGIGTSSPTTALTLGTSHTATVQNGGSNSAPAYAITSGALGVNGITAPAANTLGFVTASTERMRIDGSGNVGIGTSSPSTTLHLDSGGTPTTIQIDSDTEASIDFNDHGGSAKRYKIGTNISSNDGQLEFKDMTANAERMRIDASGNVIAVSGSLNLVGTNTQMFASSNGDDIQFKFSGTTKATINNAGLISASDGNATVPAFRFYNDSNTGMFRATTDTIGFSTAGAERMRLDSAGRTLMATTETNVISVDGRHGIVLNDKTNGFYAGVGQFSANGNASMLLNRDSDDGSVQLFFQDATEIGSITTSGSTVSYNAFSGSHWSRLTDNSKPTILKGTVIETIDEMCDWYQARFEIQEEGETRTVRQSIALPSDASVGDTLTVTFEDNSYTATIIKEADNKHTKCKISDTADSTRVYGVFAGWDNDDDNVNDMYVTAVGTHVVRVHSSVTVSAGDLLVSNGDGTAKVQDDDIIRSKTIGKVLTNIKQETYSDGSYTVPCALYCG